MPLSQLIQRVKYKLLIESMCAFHLGSIEEIYCCDDTKTKEQFMLEKFCHTNGNNFSQKEMEWHWSFILTQRIQYKARKLIQEGKVIALNPAIEMITGKGLPFIETTVEEITIKTIFNKKESIFTSLKKVTPKLNNDTNQLKLF